jgi:UDP-N-acetylmuramoyl-tripeptide--D-alanyl-D-alanine ligase
MKSQVPVIAVTGSTGKTSTKDFLAALLEPLGNVVVTKGNHNNELGLPLTICGLETDTNAMVVEMGMRGLGQIDFLCRIAEPDCGLITNIGKTHCELLGSQENIAQAKCELLPYIKENGIIALNKKDEPFLEPWLSTCKGTVVWYDAEGKSGDYWADEITQTEDGIRYRLHCGEHQQEIVLQVQGIHNVSNSLAAIAIARHLGVTWEQVGECLQKARLTGMRLDITVSDEGITVINDAYNANPDSMKSALSVLMQRKGNRKIAVLGDMYELGKYEQESHREVGRAAAELQVDYVIAVGALGHLIGEEAQAAGCPVALAETNEQAIAYLKQYAVSGDVVLVKGSRGMQMEQIVQNLMG